MNKLKYLVLTFSLIILGFMGNVLAAEPSDTETYFSSGRKDTLLNSVSSVKIDKPLPSSYSFPLGSKYKDYEVKGVAGTLNTEQINSWDYTSNINHTCTAESLNPNINCSDAFWNITNLDYSRVDGANASKVKGNFYALYKNAGVYNGKDIDVKLTIMDFSVSSLNIYKDKIPVIGFYGPKSADKSIAKYPLEAEYRIGIFSVGVNWVHVKYDFYESGTSNHLSIKGYTTYWDIDNFQGVQLLDNYDSIYAPSDSTLKYAKIDKSPYIYDGNKESLHGYSSLGAFTETFSGRSLNRVYTFTAPGNDAPDFSTPGLAAGGIWTSKVINGGHKSYNINSKDGKDNETVKENDIITYDIDYTNATSKDNNVKITETLSKGLKYVVGSGKDNNITSNPEIEENDDGTTTLTWSGNAKSSSDGTITYSATVTSSDYETVETSTKAKIGSKEYDLGTLTNHVTKPGTIVVRYLEEGSNKELLGNDYMYKSYGETYETDSKENSLYNYKLVKTPDNYKGIVGNDTITVTYYFKLKEGKLTIRHLEEGTNKELIPNEVSTKYYGDNYETYPKDSTSIPNYVQVNKTSNYEGVICQDETIVVYYYKLNAGKLTIHHYETDTTNKLLDDEVIIKGFNETYTTESKEILLPDYNFDSSSDNTSGQITKQNTEVTYYYSLKKGKVTTKYLEKGTNKELNTPEIKEYKYGENYSTDKKTVDSKYILESISGKPVGIVNSDNTEIIYYYTQKNEKIDSLITITGPKEIDNSTEKVEYKINYTAKVSDYTGDINLVITDRLPGTIDEKASKLDGGKYSSFDNSVVWGIKISNFDSSTDDEISFSKTITIVFKDLNTKQNILYNEIRGNITLDTTGNTICDYTLTKLNNKGSITTKYVNTDGDEISTSETNTGNIGDRVVLKEKEIEGYNIYKKPDSEIVKIEESNTTYKYIYKAVTYNIITKAISDGGRIIGDSFVTYGSDSKEKVLITAEDGYYIKTIKINNEPYTIPENQTSFEIPAFKEVKENKIIEVSFESAETDVGAANTASPVQIIAIVGGVLLIGGGVYFVLKKYNIVK